MRWAITLLALLALLGARTDGGGGGVRGNAHRGEASIIEPVAHFGSNLKLFLDSAFVVTDVGVTTMTDQSPEADNAIQTTDANQPALEAACSPNGLRACVAFDGGNDNFDVTGVTLTQPYTVFIAMQYDQSFNGEYIYDGLGGTDRAILWEQGDGFMGMWAGVNLQTIAQDTAPHYLTFIYDDNCTAYSSAVLVASGDCGGRSFGLTTLGSRNDDMSLAEWDLFQILVVDGAASTADVQSMYEYQVDRFGAL